MRLVRGNAWTELERAPAWFLDLVAFHLAVPVELTEFKYGARFGASFIHENRHYGSLLHKRALVAAGLTPHVQALAQHYNQPCELVDIRERPAGGYPMFSVNVPWREYQDRVHHQMIEHGYGVVDVPPRGGKTSMAARIVDVLALPTVYVAPSLPIVLQTYKRFCEWFGEEYVARLDGEATAKEKDVSKKIVIATAASAVRQPREWWRTREILLIDEFHHGAADTYHQINAHCDHLFHRYCFTGTHFRTGEDGLAMEAVCSQVLQRVSVSELVNTGFLATPRVFFLPTKSSGKDLRGIQSYDVLYKHGIVRDEARNHEVCEVVGALAAKGIPTIVLTRRREHADNLGDLIPDAKVVKGGEQELTSKTVANFAAGHFGVLVGTTVIGEGVDLPRAAALVYASGGRGGVGMIQSYFRPLTATADKSVGRIYDFVDNSNRLLLEQSVDRLAYARTYLGDSNVKYCGT